MRLLSPRYVRAAAEEVLMMTNVTSRLQEDRVALSLRKYIQIILLAKVDMTLALLAGDWMVRSTLAPMP